MTIDLLTIFSMLLAGGVTDALNSLWRLRISFLFAGVIRASMGIIQQQNVTTNATRDRTENTITLPIYSTCCEYKLLYKYTASRLLLFITFRAPGMMHVCMHQGQPQTECYASLKSFYSILQLSLKRCRWKH